VNKVNTVGTKAFMVFVLVLMAVISGYPLVENSTLNRSNNELTAKIDNATQANQDLQKELEQTKQEMQALKNNFTALSSVFDVDPNIETRLGVEVLELNDGSRTQYIWFTGEVENMEAKTLYDVRLMFTLTTERGNETKYYIIGVLDPHQVMTVRHALFASLSDRIFNWTMIPVSAPER
jgi:outer membrane murein-binding lipoprotein Lpp